MTERKTADHVLTVENVKWRYFLFTNLCHKDEIKFPLKLKGGQYISEGQIGTDFQLAVS